MRIYKSNTINTFFSVVLAIVAITLVVVTLLFFRRYWGGLFIFLFPFTLLSSMPIFTAYYSIENGYLIKQSDKKNFAGKSTDLRLKLTEIVKIEKCKNIFGKKFVALYYNDSHSIDIYLDAKEIDDFIKEVKMVNLL
jgi:hypothetical protein